MQWIKGGEGRTTLLGSLLLAAGLAACGGPVRSRRAETVPAEELPVAADTIVVPYGDLPVAAWLGDRRWLVVAADFNAAVIADFASQAAAPLGGERNPELANPYSGFAIGDTAFVADWGKQRVSIWSPAGTLVGAISGPAVLRGTLPRARDAAGQLYFQIPPDPGPDGSGNRDSIVVVRSDPGLSRFDTVARLAPMDIAEVQLNTGRRFERLVFSGNDWWGVRPDGRLWIARVNLNRVNTIADGKEIRGEALPDPVLEVKLPDRQAWVNSFPEEMRGTLKNMPFAPLKPPFEHGFADPDGKVWLRKSRAYGDSVRRYHVVDTAGMLGRVFTTVGDGVLIAAGRGAALMAEQFADGVRLMELRIPAPLPGAGARPQ